MITRDDIQELYEARLVRADGPRAVQIQISLDAWLAGTALGDRFDGVSTDESPGYSS